MPELGDALYQFDLNVHVKDGKKEMFYLMMHSTHFIYGYMASDLW